MSDLLTQALDVAPDTSGKTYKFQGNTVPVRTTDGTDLGVVGIAKNSPKKGTARGFLTFEAGVSQQSCPLAAVNAAIGQDVLPVASILNIYVKVGRMSQKDADATLKLVKAAS